MTASGSPANPSAEPLQNLLISRIRAEGPVPFAEFMRECLYHPEYGYYSRAEAHRFGDYYTSVDVHPIFGRLLARQLAEMWELAGAPAPFLVVEAAAGTGRLAGHILDFAQRQLPEFYRSLRYIAVEPSAARRAQAEGRVAPHAAAGRFSTAAMVPGVIPSGCVFSNELLDALPTHRVLMKGGRLREVYVGLEEERLAELLGEPSTPEVESYFSRQGIVLAEGQQAEACLDACRWIETVGSALHEGFVLSIDYGHEANRLYDQSHNRGTVLAYRNHQAGEALLATPGCQDLTAHVDFTALDLWGRGVGLERTGFATQAEFLIALGRGNEFADLYERDAEQSEVEKLRARLLLKNLIHPEGLGETFKVLIQHKGVDFPKLTGLARL